jgi:hypothetical protein
MKAFRVVALLLLVAGFSANRLFADCSFTYVGQQLEAVTDSDGCTE